MLQFAASPKSVITDVSDRIGYVNRLEVLATVEGSSRDGGDALRNIEGASCSSHRVVVKYGEIFGEQDTLYGSIRGVLRVD